MVFDLAALLLAISDVGEAVGVVAVSAALIVVAYRAYRFIRSAL